MSSSTVSVHFLLPPSIWATLIYIHWQLYCLASIVSFSCWWVVFMRTTYVQYVVTGQLLMSTANVEYSDPLGQHVYKWCYKCVQTTMDSQLPCYLFSPCISNRHVTVYTGSTYVRTIHTSSRTYVTVQVYMKTLNWRKISNWLKCTCLSVCPSVCLSTCTGGSNYHEIAVLAEIEWRT